MKILKFGGSSLSSPGALKRVAEIVKRELHQQSSFLLVVSALEHTTDELLDLARSAGSGLRVDTSQLRKKHQELIELSFPASSLLDVRASTDFLFAELDNALEKTSNDKDISKRAVDKVLSFGEMLAAALVHHYLESQIENCFLLDSRKLILTDDHFGNARAKGNKTLEQIKAACHERSGVGVIAGFIGSTEQGDVTTLGRGGSDYTASLLAAALEADEIQLWTTVDGIMTADPAKVPQAIGISALSYEEALELGHFGTELICASAIGPARDCHIPISVKNFLRPEFEGTLISSETANKDLPIVGISAISRVALLRLQGEGLVGISGTASRLFAALSKAEANVILISQASSEHSICFAIEPEALSAAGQIVQAEFRNEIENRQAELVFPEKEHSVVAVVGANMRHRPGVAGKVFQALGKNGINVAAIAQGSSELNISFVIERTDEGKALNALHDAFFLSHKKIINLFCLGMGKVGRALLEQLAAHNNSPAAEHLELRLVGIGNSKGHYFSRAGIQPTHIEEHLRDGSSQSESAKQFVAAMRQLNLPNSIFVDLTANEDVANCYASVLDGSISIVTPNKRANSGELSRYHDLRLRAARANVKFFYETNVGAGLPIINTLNDLLASGDEILRIEAVLSGTLSFIFNSLHEASRFSEIVQLAQAKGYTEPDPREDLSGKDVARKLLILGREMGLPIEEANIEVTSLVPKSCEKEKSVEDFYRALRKEDSNFERMRQTELQGEKVYRYIGRIEDGRASVSLTAVDSKHPFYALSGSDNIVSFTTKRYFERPLVVKGPGAGTDVTAAGVLADILRVTTYLA